ncbi:MAG TPA: DUF1080 domain-containing protein [Cyclobacteriaceae bacterium]|nr:DUF1080 domain-containing protein [Cyclobacteriaceae bacterium]
MKYRIILLCSLALFYGCATNSNRRSIFNGKDLSEWDVYIAPPADSIPPPGLNVDPTHVFSVVDMDGETAMRVSGETFGGISTKQEFENYHLRVEFKWGKNKIESFKERKRDSGILYHAVGSHGVDARAWMRSQELQIQEGDCGDYWGVAGGTFDVPARKNEKDQYVFDEKSPLVKFSATSEAGRRCIKNPDAEKRTGEWNVVDLYCFGDSSVHVINGTVVMRLFNSRQEDNGTETRLAKGKIQLQSEGCEIYYRNLIVESISQIPSDL